jgi:hypothetical protein
MQQQPATPSGVQASVIGKGKLWTLSRKGAGHKLGASATKEDPGGLGGKKMRVKTCLAVGAVAAVAAAVAVHAVSLVSVTFRVFRTTAALVSVSQTSSNGVPRFDYKSRIGEYLVAQALGTVPTSNQVLAIEFNCDTTAANLVVFDKFNSNTTLIASSTSFDKVVQANLHTGNTNQERFVSQMAVGPVGNLAGGFLTVAGRVDIDTNGCAKAVLVAIDRDRHDHDFDDRDVSNKDSDHKDKLTITRRAGQAHFVGVLDVISGGATNTVLVPLGHLTFRRQLDEFIAE